MELSNHLSLHLGTGQDLFEYNRLLNDNFLKLEREFLERSASMLWYKKPGVTDTEALKSAIATGKYVFIPSGSYIINEELDLSKVWGFGTLELPAGPYDVFNPLEMSYNKYSEEQIRKFLESAETYAAFAAYAKAEVVQLREEVDEFLDTGRNPFYEAMNKAATDANNAAVRANDAAEEVEGWQGTVEWDAKTQFHKNNTVTHLGSTWQAKRPNINVPPVEGADWLLLARKGLDGTGSVTTVNGIEPDITGNVTLEFPSTLTPEKSVTASHDEYPQGFSVFRTTLQSWLDYVNLIPDSGEITTMVVVETLLQDSSHPTQRITGINAESDIVCIISRVHDGTAWKSPVVMYPSVTPEDREKWDTVLDVPKRDITLVPGINTIESKLDSLIKVKSIVGKTVTNLVPNFLSSKWVNTGAGVVQINGPYRLDLKGVVEDVAVSVELRYEKENVEFTLSHEGTGYIGMHFLSDTAILKVVDYVSTGSVTATSPAGTKRIQVYCGSNGKTGDFTFKNLMLTESNVKTAFVSGCQGIVNPTIEVIQDNLLPRFREWAGIAYGITESGYSISANESKFKDFSTRNITVPVHPNTTYTFAVKLKAYSNFTTTGVGVYYNLAEYSDEKGTVVVDHTKPPFQDVPGELQVHKVITTHPDTRFLNIVVGANNFTGMYAAHQVSLTLGDNDASFKPQTRKRMSLKTTLHDGDELSLTEDGRIQKKSSTRELEILDLPCKVVDSYPTFKVVDVDVGWMYSKVPSVLIKFDGAFLYQNTAGVVSKGGDTYYLDSAVNGVPGHHLRFILFNADTGWGTQYTPTEDELKAYFYGYTMYNNSVPAVDNVPRHYTGTGQKAWVDVPHRTKFDAKLEATLITPTSIVPHIGDWRPYKLVYKTQKPYTEFVDVVGDTTVPTGSNHVYIREDIVVRETVQPVQDDTWGEHYYINAKPSSIRAQLNKRNSNIIAVYKNGEIDHDWVIEVAAGTGHGRAIANIPKSMYDPTAEYSVDYIIEDKSMTIPLSEVVISLDESLGSIASTLTNESSQLSSRVTHLESRQNWGFGIDSRGLYITIGGTS